MKPATFSLRLDGSTARAYEGGPKRNFLDHGFELWFEPGLYSIIGGLW
jgi:hypothetical protein